MVVFSLFMVVFGSWAFASPLFSSPDEHTHAIRAASVVRGQIIGRRTTAPWTVVRAPAVYGQQGERLSCWTFKPDVTPACMGPFEGSHRLVRSDTYVGRYNPLYYGLVGFPSLLSRGDVGIYLMRLLSAAVSAALVTLAVLAALRAPRPSLALLGIAFALTPMVLFLAGTVNPNGMEVAAAICLWTAGLLALDPRRRTTSVVAMAVIGACCLVVARGLSPFWLAAILALLAVAVVSRPRRTLLGDGRMLAAAAVVGGTAAVAGLWLLLTDGLAVLPIGQKTDAALPNVALSILGGTRRLLEEMIGLLQYLDTSMPFAVYLLWFAGVATLVLLAVVIGDRRAWVALLLCIGLTVLAPLLQLPSARTAGLVWQGRYGLPLAVGIPILATWALSAARAEVVVVLRRLAMLLVVAIGVALVAAFYWAGRRNAVGVDGPLFFPGREDWRPPVPFALLLLTFTSGAGALVGLFLRLARREGSEPAEPTTESESVLAATAG